MNDRDLQTLLARQEIRDVHSRYCRGLDRMDKPMAYSVWHEDGTAHYEGMFEGTGHGFVDWVWEAHSHMERHSHQITNVLAEIDGDRATREAYVTVVLWTLPDADGNQTEHVGRGRYLARWERREGRFAIVERFFMQDMGTVTPLARADISPSSARDASDPSFSFIPAYDAGS